MEEQFRTISKRVINLMYGLFVDQRSGYTSARRHTFNGSDLNTGLKFSTRLKKKTVRGIPVSEKSSRVSGSLK